MKSDLNAFGQILKIPNYNISKLLAIIFFLINSDRNYLRPNGMLYSDEELMPGKQATSELMYHAISVGISALEANTSTSDTAENDRSKVIHLLWKTLTNVSIFSNI